MATPEATPELGPSPEARATPEPTPAPTPTPAPSPPAAGKIAFTSSRDKDLQVYVDLEVYVMNADGSGQTNLSNNSAMDAAPAWSP